jgi:glutamyl-Q tRNA(Asp) synthetase
VYQSRRTDAYEAALERLQAAGWVYRCVCSRKDIAAAHRRHGKPGSLVYPGTCRDGPAAAGRRSRVLRVRTTAERIGIQDRLQGSFSQRLEDEVGDFVLRRREGYIAYQLAVVVDDAWQGISHVVRGVDLLDSTPRQAWLQRLLGLPTPSYMHLPVAAHASGQKLSKQSGAPAVEARQAPELAWQTLACLGQSPPRELRGAAPAEIWRWGLAHWQPGQLAGMRRIHSL